MTVKIALFANHDSKQIAEVAAAVAAAGGLPVVLDLRIGGAPAESTRPAVAISSTGADRWGGVDFSQIRAIHIRGTAPRTLPTLPPVLNPVSQADYRNRFLVEQGFQAATYAFFEHQAAEGKLVVNRLTGAYIDHNSKSQFYEKLRVAGFTVPHSLSTNCPETAAAFLDQVGEAVIKPAIGVGSTRLVGPDDRARLDELTRCPALFQQRIVGATLRVHVVGDTMVRALRIVNDGIDSRTATEAFEPVELAPEIAAAVVRANRSLGLHYAAWDGIIDADGRFFLLDCNPGPYVLWLPADARAAVFGALARYLITFAHTGSLEEASAAVAAEAQAPCPERG